MEESSGIAKCREALLVDGTRGKMSIEHTIGMYPLNNCVNPRSRLMTYHRSGLEHLVDAHLLILILRLICRHGYAFAHPVSRKMASTLCRSQRRRC